MQKVKYYIFDENDGLLSVKDSLLDAENYLNEVREEGGSINEMIVVRGIKCTIINKFITLKD